MIYLVTADVESEAGVKIRTLQQSSVGKCMKNIQSAVNLHDSACVVSALKRCGSEKDEVFNFCKTEEAVKKKKKKSTNLTTRRQSSIVCFPDSFMCLNGWVQP